MNWLDILFGRKGLGRPLRKRPKPRPRLEGKWQYGFEDLLFRGYCKNAKQMFIGCEKRDIAELLDKYIYQGNQYPVCDEVKIKCKVGCIQIERIK